MNLEKAYDKVDRKTLWDILDKYGLGGKLLDAIKSFYGNSRTCVRVEGRKEGRKGNFFEVKVMLRQGWVMSPWLFNVYMDSVVREIKMDNGEEGFKMLSANGGRSHRG